MQRDQSPHRLKLGLIARRMRNGTRKTQVPPCNGRRKVVLCRRRSKTRKLERTNRKMKAKIEQIKGDMAEIDAQQKCIAEGQKKVKKKFEEVEYECKKLRMEAKLIWQQSAGTQLRLNLLFQILKAREANDVARDAYLTLSLRQLMGTKE
ncbi:hypothetical protein CFOL_v3_09110 [Cephalotus follicularis]|uniref:Uncharacterized protein n=1 Tax=Cephalotus follicularis TaxID=3775 RepID=A0A1Q3BCH0_CEPFO|nr:hypothetical protein CFOL_v3_09110 [Cephalotus follicularis]